MASSLAAGNQSLESKLLRTLESIDASLSNQNSSRSVAAGFSSIQDGAATKASEQVARLAGTMAFHMERAVGGLVAFRSALNTVYDRLNDPRLTHLGRSQTSGQFASASRNWGFIPGLGAFPVAGGGGGGGGGSGFYRGASGAQRPASEAFDRLFGGGTPGGWPLARQRDVSPGARAQEFQTNRSFGSNAFQTSLQTVHTSGQKAAASSLLSASRLQMAVDLLSTAAVMQMNISSSIIRMFDSMLQAGAPNSAATLNKSFQLLFATIGKDLAPMALEFAGQLQKLSKEWDSLDESSKRSYLAIVRFVSMIDSLVGALGVLGTALSFFDRNVGKFDVGATRAQRAALGNPKDDPSFSGVGLAPGIQMERAVENLADQNKAGGGLKFMRGLIEAPLWLNPGTLPMMAGREGLRGAGAFDPDPNKAVVGIRSAIQGKGVSGGKKDDELALAFARTGNAQFTSLDQAWRTIQASIIDKDPLDAKIFEQQAKEIELLEGINSNTKRTADKVGGGVTD